MVPEGWHEVRLGEVFGFSRGVSWSRDDEVLDGVAGVPVVGIPNVRDDHLDLSDIRHLAPGAVAGRAPAPVGTILMVGSNGNPSRVGNCGPLTTEGYYFASFLLGLTPKAGLDGEFAARLLASPRVQRQISSEVQGSTGLRNINAGTLRTQSVPLPPLPEQKKIAVILSSVDDAIAATRKVIEQTERVKKGLLQTLMTRGIGHTRVKKTEIGEIPEGWEVQRLGKLVRPVFVERPPQDDEPYRPVIVRRRHGGVEAPEEKLGRTILVKQQYEPQPGLFLISKRQIIHLACGIVPTDIPANATISKEYLQLRSTGALDLEFLDLYSRRPSFYRSIERCTYGVDREKFVLNVPWFMNEPVPMPPLRNSGRSWPWSPIRLGLWPVMSVNSSPSPASRPPSSNHSSPAASASQWTDPHARPRVPPGRRPRHRLPGPPRVRARHQGPE